MKLHTYTTLQLFPTTKHLDTFEKVCMAYQHIYARLFAEVYQAHLQGYTTEIDYNAMIRKLDHEDESLGTNVFSAYPKVVAGALLKVKSVFMPVRNHLDVHAMYPYLERERTANTFCLPIEENGSGKLVLPHIGELSKEGRTKNALFVEFVRSKTGHRRWHGKAFSEINFSMQRTVASCIFALAPIREAPLVVRSTEGKNVALASLAEYARFVDLKSQSAGSALKRMRTAGSLFNHDYNQGKRDYDNRMFELERRAHEYATIVAEQIAALFSNVAYCLPVTPGHQITWDYLGLDIIMAEVERLMLIAAVERKQMLNPVHKFTNMAYCVQCGNGNASKLDGTDVVCGKRGHARFTIFDAVANNTARALIGKL